MIGVQNQICELQFFYGLNLSQRLFAISDNLSKTLQKESISALSGLHLAELTAKIYQKMQSDEEAELFFKFASKKASDYPFINKAALLRKRKRPNVDLSNAFSMSTMFQGSYCKIFSNILEHLESLHPTKCAIMLNLLAIVHLILIKVIRNGKIVWN